MGPAWIALGALVVAVGLGDVFFTVLHVETGGLLAVRAYRLTWEASKHVIDVLPSAMRAVTRPAIAPLLVVLNLGLWLGAPIVGFACIYAPAVEHGGFRTGPAGHSFGASLYYSAATLTSLSFSDMEPRSLVMHSLSAAETLVGLAILTLTITYMLNLYSVLRHQGVLATRLYHATCGSNEPLVMLRSHLRGDEALAVGTLVRELHRSLTEFNEGTRRYPLAWYFHTRRPYRSLPYIFWVMASVMAVLRWVVPPDHPAATDPWLPGFATGFEDVLGQLAGRFLPRPLPEPATPLPPEQFRAVSARGGIAGGRAGNGAGGPDGEAPGVPDDDAALLARFLELEHGVAALTGRALEAEACRYDRYAHWVVFVHRARAFVAMASRDLGLDPERMYADPQALQG